MFEINCFIVAITINISQGTFSYLLICWMGPRSWSHGRWVDGEEIIVFSNYLAGIIPQSWEVATIRDIMVLTKFKVSNEKISSVQSKMKKDLMIKDAKSIERNISVSI